MFKQEIGECEKDFKMQLQNNCLKDGKRELVIGLYNYIFIFYDLSQN